jgi:hypothetical protein
MVVLFQNGIPENKRVLLDGFLGTKEFRKFAFNGHFSPDKKENNIDLKCEIRNFVWNFSNLM